MNNLKKVVEEEEEVVYAGFLSRFIAYVIDLTLVHTCLFMTFVVPGGTFVLFHELFPPEEYGAMFNFQATMFTLLIIWLVFWLYFSIMESKFQATLGKMIMQLKVIDMEEEAPTFGRASGRFFGQTISYLSLCIGFFIVGFTQRKQALHDMMAGCLVVRK